MYELVTYYISGDMCGRARCSTELSWDIDILEDGASDFNSAFSSLNSSILFLSPSAPRQVLPCRCLRHSCCPFSG